MALTRQIISDDDRYDLEAQYVGALIGKWMPFTAMDIPCLDPDVIFTPVLKEIYVVILELTSKGKEPMLISVASALLSKNPNTTWDTNKIFRLCLCVTRKAEGEAWDYNNQLFFMPDEDICRGNAHTITMAYQEFLLGEGIEQVIDIQEAGVGYPVERVAAMMETLEKTVKDTGRTAISLHHAMENYRNQTVIFRQSYAVTGSTYPFWWGRIVNPLRNNNIGIRPLFCQPGHLNLLMAQRKAGKSTCGEMIAEWNCQKGQRWVYVHAENTMSDIVDDMIRRYGGADYTKLLQGQEEDKMHYVADLISRWPGEIYYIHGADRDIDSIIREIKEIRPDGCVFDYTQILEVTDKVRRLPDHEVYAYRMRKMKQLAEWSRHPMFVFALAQTNDEGGAFGAKSQEMQAQIVWQWYREFKEDTTGQKVKSKLDLLGRQYLPWGTMMINYANNFEAANETMNFFGSRKFMAAKCTAEVSWWNSVYKMYGDWILTALGVGSEKDIPNSELIKLQKGIKQDQVGKSDFFKV